MTVPVVSPSSGLILLAVQPATQEFAVNAFPSMIVALLQGNLQIDTANSVGSQEIVKIWVPPLRKVPLTILREDFDLIKKIAESSTLRMFPSETLTQAEARIRARVKLEFSGRGIPK